MPAIRSRRVVTPEGIRPATIHFGEQIERIEPYNKTGTDYGDLVIMPGLVDTHVHVNEPGRTKWEGFETATRAAAAGGITTIVDMPLNSIPATTTLSALESKVNALAGKCRVDVALWGGVVPGNTGQLGPMMEAGARGFKCFLIDSGVEEFPSVNEAQLREAATQLAKAGKPLLVHAELPGPVAKAAGKAAKHDPSSYQSYLESRPQDAEDQAIEMLLRVSRDTGAQIHVVHLSSATALEIIRRARRANLPLSVETTPHYLHFESEQIEDGRNEFKCAPPIRNHENRERLWRGLRNGLIDIVVSDHSPCTPKLKRGDFHTAWGGIASLQFVLPIVWTEARDRGFGFADLASWMCEGPARLASLATKGLIAEGSDADFVIWSPEQTLTVDEAIIEHRHKVTPYSGETLAGVVHETWLRGEQVFAHGKHAGEPRGRWVV